MRFIRKINVFKSSRSSVGSHQQASPPELKQQY